MEFVQSSKANLHLMLLMKEKKPDRLYTLYVLVPIILNLQAFKNTIPNLFGDRLAIISYVKSKNCQSFSTIP